MPNDVSILGKNTVGPVGLCPTLIVFGTLPRPIRTRRSPKQIENSRNIDKSMPAAPVEQEGRIISFALTQKYGPKAIEPSKELRKFPARSLVLVYRTMSNKWEGLHMSVSIEGDTVIVKTFHGRKIHRSKCRRPWVCSQLPGSRMETFKIED